MLDLLPRSIHVTSSIVFFLMLVRYYKHFPIGLIEKSHWTIRRSIVFVSDTALTFFLAANRNTTSYNSFFNGDSADFNANFSLWLVLFASRSWVMIVFQLWFWRSFLRWTCLLMKISSASFTLEFSASCAHEGTRLLREILIDVSLEIRILIRLYVLLDWLRSVIVWARF